MVATPDLTDATVADVQSHLRDLVKNLSVENAPETSAEFQRVLRDARFEEAVLIVHELLRAAAALAKTTSDASERLDRSIFFPLMRESADAADFHEGPYVYERFELRRATVQRIIAGITPENEFFTEIKGWVFRISTKGFHEQLVAAGEYPIYATRLSDSKGFAGYFNSKKDASEVSFRSLSS